MIGRVLFTAASTLAIAVLYAVLQMLLPGPAIDGTMEVEVVKGSSFRHAAGTLKERGLIRDIRLFTAIGRLQGVDRRLVPGFYQFYGSPSPWDVLNTIKNDRIIQWQVTIIEGDTLLEIEKAFTSKGIMNETEFMGVSLDPEFLSAMSINAPSMEGYLFPDTYGISKGTPPEDVFMMMVNRMRQVLDEELLVRAAEIGFNEREVLTLASIIEKEAVFNRERPIISGVYHNRLRIGMPLQADPTAIYGIKPFSAGITRRDIRRKTRYNTYFIKGLPPGPIASAGLKSILAALYPANVPYLYFVANNEGGHIFSRTLQEHMRAASDYRKKRLAVKVSQTRLLGTVQTVEAPPK